jgi:Ca-activated chloride channel family protein
VVGFAGDATVICPLTTDHDSVLSFIDRLTTEEDLRPGTAIGNAIHLGVNRFGDTETGRVMILLTDGENNKGLDPMDTVIEAKEAGVRIYTVGVGTPEGAQLPEVNQPVLGGPAYRRDAQGNPIMVGLDVGALQAIADQTGGRYFSATNQGEVRTLYSRIAHEGVTEFQSRRLVRRDELAPYFLLIACLLLVMEAFYSYIAPAEVHHANARA